MNIRVSYIERKWFDNFGSFYTYLLENAEVVEVVDEDELVWYIAKSLRDLEVHPDDVQGLREQIVKNFGIAEKYVDLILHKVRNWLIMYEAELESPEEQEDVVKARKEIDEETFRQIVNDVARMYLGLDYDRESVIKAVMLQYGLDEWEARELVSAAETRIFS